MTRRAAIWSTVRLPRDEEYSRLYRHAKALTYKFDNDEADQDAAGHGWDRATALEAIGDGSDAVSGEVALGWLRWVLATLTPKEEFVLTRHYGLDGQEPWTQERIGEEMGMTRASVWQIEAKALRKLRAPARQVDTEVGAYLTEWRGDHPTTFVPVEVMEEKIKRVQAAHAKWLERERQRRTRPMTAAERAAHAAWLERWLHGRTT